MYFLHSKGLQQSKPKPFSLLCKIEPIFFCLFFSPPYLVNRARLWIKQPDLLHILGQRPVLPSCFCTNKLCDFIFNRPSSRYRSLSETWRASDSSAAVTAGRRARWLLTCSTLALERALNSKPSPASSSLATPSSQECVVKMKWAMCNLPLHKAPQKEWEIRWGALFSVWIREQGVGNRSFRVVPMLCTDVLFFFFLFFFLLSLPFWNKLFFERRKPNKSEMKYSN